MVDCFISYAGPDEVFAASVARFLKLQGLGTFLARLSIPPGQQWGQEIRRALRDSPWVLFLASRAACASPYVQQEVGGAVFGGKKLVPVVWDQSPADLPGWAKEYQALDLRGLTSEAVSGEVQRVADAIQADKSRGNLIVIGLLAALVVFAFADNKRDA